MLRYLKRFEESLDTFNEMPTDEYRGDVPEDEQPKDEDGPRERFPGWPKIDSGEF